MVHCYYYGAQYEIYLNKQIDFYNDVLPIWMFARERIELVKINDKQSKLIIIPCNKLYERFQKLKHAENYILDNIRNNENKEKSKYYHVKKYKDYIKHNKSLPNPISSKELEDLEESYRKSEMNEDFSELNRLFERLMIQRIISNNEFFKEIVNIEKSLTDIELTDEEKDLINWVIVHPKLKGLIDFHGFNLIERFE